MKNVAIALILVQLVGCSTYEHNRIRSEQAVVDAELGLDEEYGVNNRNHPVADALHGAVWVVGTNILKGVL